MTLFRARALCATSRKRIGVAALSGAERVIYLARQHGTSRKFVRAQRELARQAVDLAFAEPTAPSLVEPFRRVSNAWVRRFVLGVVLIVHGSYRQVIELLRDLFGVSPYVGALLHGSWSWRVSPLPVDLRKRWPCSGRSWVARCSTYG